MDLLAQCELLHRQENYQTIIRLLEAIPEEERTPEQDLELARAYNNQADPCTPEGRALLQRAIALLELHRDTLGEDYSWNFRMGYAHYYLDQEKQALDYFQRAWSAIRVTIPSTTPRRRSKHLLRTAAAG